MPNLTIENIDLGGVILEGHADTDGTLRNAAGAPATFAAGTILARHDTDLKYYPYDPAGDDGLDAAKAVLTYEIAAVPATSDVAVRVLTRGVVNKARLRIHDGTTITEAHLDELRDYGIDPQNVKQLGRYDNPQS